MTRETVRIAAAQTPEFREDAPAALAYLIEVAEQASEAGVRLLCLPEGYLQGYLTDHQTAQRNALDLGAPAFSALIGKFPVDAPMMVLGLIEAEGQGLYNTAAVIHRRRLVGRYRKRHLLKSELCFQPGDETLAFEVDGLRFGINICYDTNFPEAAAAVMDQGASLLVCPANNMLPRQIALEWKDKHNPIRGERCRETGLWLISADVTGARDDQIGWGPTAVLNPAGEVVAQLPLDAPGLLVFDLPLTRTPA